jgi:hypothetical protein
VTEPSSVRDWDGAGPREADWLDGSCLLLRAETVAALGPIDEGYFLYFEELDYFVRMRQAGWRIECEPRARAWQEPGSKPSYLWARNRLRFLARNAPRRLLLEELVRLLRPSRRRRLGPDPSGSSRTAAELTAMVHFLIRRNGPPPERFRPHGSAVPATGDGEPGVIP